MKLIRIPLKWATNWKGLVKIMISWNNPSEFLKISRFQENLTFLEISAISYFMEINQYIWLHVKFHMESWFPPNPLNCLSILVEFWWVLQLYNFLHLFTLFTLFETLFAYFHSFCIFASFCTFRVFCIPCRKTLWEWWYSRWKLGISSHFRYFSEI